MLNAKIDRSIADIDFMIRTLQTAKAHLEAGGAQATLNSQVRAESQFDGARNNVALAIRDGAKVALLLESI